MRLITGRVTRSEPAAGATIIPSTCRSRSEPVTRFSDSTSSWESPTISTYPASDRARSTACTRLPKYGFVNAEIERPTVCVRPAASDRATTLRRYPVFSMASSTRRRVAVSTLRVRLSTCETVDAETPASRATSPMVVTGAARFCPRDLRSTRSAGHCARRAREPRTPRPAGDFPYASCRRNRRAWRTSVSGARNQTSSMAARATGHASNSSSR